VSPRPEEDEQALDRLSVNAERMRWDWKEQVDLQDLFHIIRQVSGAQVFITEVDTGSDYYEIIVSNYPMTQDQAQEISRCWVKE
jgi:hypothetical protein